MRVAVDYRVMSTEAADRGMGRYTQQQLRAVVRQDPETEYVVLLYPECRTDLIDRDVREAQNVELRRLSLPTLRDGIHSVAEGDTLRYSAELQQWLADEGVDVYHATTPFIEPIAADFDACSLVATLYDLIPLIYPRQYFGTNGQYPSYLRATQLVRRAARVIAISESARWDALTFLGYPTARSEVAYPAIEPHFRRLRQDEASNILARIDQTLPDDFILGVTGIHHSKNAAALLAAHRKVVMDGDPVGLVLVLPTPNAHGAFLSQYELGNDVVPLYGLTDEELAALFNEASLVVHPSRYEGFGYPVAEAMSCGTPVITTNGSSLKEVAGDAVPLVDPDDVEQFVNAIRRVRSSATLREELSRRGLERAEAFRGQELGDVTLRAYQGARNTPEQDGGNRRRVAVWSSLPPLNCGVGDYTAELIDPLSQRYEVELFVGNGYVPDPNLSGRHMIHHFSAFERRDRQASFDEVIYQMGGTYMQEFMYEPIRRRAGIVVLHDLQMGLGFFFLARSNQKLDRFRKDVLAVEGEDVLKDYDRITRATDPVLESLDELFAEHYLLSWIVKSSHAQIVHMDAAKAALEARYSEARPYVVDMGVADPWARRSRGDQSVVRWRYGLPESTFVIGLFGTVVRVKRVEAALKAIARLRERGVDVLALIVGEPSDATYFNELQGQVARLGLQNAVRMPGRVGREVFDDLLIGVDAIVNLRYPSREGMSAILIRALGAGKPLVISDIPEWAFLPEEGCWRIAPDAHEVESIADRLERLATDQEVRERAGAENRAFFERRGSLAHMAEQYAQVIEAVRTHRSFEADREGVSVA